MLIFISFCVTTRIGLQALVLDKQFFSYKNLRDPIKGIKQLQIMDGRTTDEVFQEQCFRWERGASVGVTICNYQEPM